MSFPLAATLICFDLDCNTVFDSRTCRNVCPRCQSTETYPVEKFFRLRAGQTFTSAAEAEVARLLHVVTSV